MGKAGRIACITTPWVLTLASFITIALIETAGWNNGNLNQYYFMRADMSEIDVSSAGGNEAEGIAIDTALAAVKNSDSLKDLYTIYLWNYCTAPADSPDDTECSKKKKNFVFDPVQIWGLDVINRTSSSLPDLPSEIPEADRINDAIDGKVEDLQESKDKLENDILGEGAAKALDTYRKVAKWMFIAYGIAFWTTLATLIVGILAIFTRWGSLLTWILAIVSTLFTFAAVLTSTVLFSVLLGALKGALNDYNVHLSLGRSALIVAWLSVAFSVAATTFWLFSVCCCSGRSNPHHKGNKGGLWKAEPKGMGYGPGAAERGRGLKVEKTGGGYERVGSPYMGAQGGEGDQMPLQQYPQYPGQTAGYTPQQTGYAPGPGFEPYRHG